MPRVRTGYRPPPAAYRTCLALAQGLMRSTAHTRAWAFGTTGAMEDAIAYLAASGASSQADGCLALAKLLRHNVLPGLARTTAVKLGAIDLLVSALRTHPHDTAVQAHQPPANPAPASSPPPTPTPTHSPTHF